MAWAETTGHCPATSPSSPLAAQTGRSHLCAGLGLAPLASFLPSLREVEHCIQGVPCCEQFSGSRPPFTPERCERCLTRVFTKGDLLTTTPEFPDVPFPGLFFFSFSKFVLFFGSVARRILVPQPEMEFASLQWKHRAAITRSPGNFLLGLF